MSENEENHNDTSLDLSRLAERQDILKDGLQDFLDANKLHLSKQNFERAFQHLLAATNHFDTITLYDVQNYLQQILEYHEHVIDTMNRTGLAEESLIKLIITADNEQDPKQQNNVGDQANGQPSADQRAPWKFDLKSLPLPVAVSLCLLICVAIATPFIPNKLHTSKLQTTDAYNEIGVSSKAELKELVKQLSDVEKALGNNVTTAQIWSDVKSLDAVTKHGYKSSYKNFTPEQWAAAKTYLETRIKSLQAQ